MENLFGEVTPDPVDRKSMDTIRADVFAKLRDGRWMEVKGLCAAVGATPGQVDNALDTINKMRGVVVSRMRYSDRDKPAKVRLVFTETFNQQEQ